MIFAFFGINYYSGFLKIFRLVLIWYIFFLPLYMYLFDYLYLKCVSCKQCIVGPFVFAFVLSNLTVCLLICVFRPYTFKVIISLVGLLSTMFVTIFYLQHLFFVFLFSPFLSSLVIIEHFIWFQFISPLSMLIILLYKCFKPCVKNFDIHFYQTISTFSDTIATLSLCIVYILQYHIIVFPNPPL